MKRTIKCSSKLFSIILLLAMFGNWTPNFAAGNHLDYGFSNDGKVALSFGAGSPNNQAFDVAVQSNGSVVVVGTSDANGTNDIAVARFNSNGLLDSTFNSDGRVLTNFNNQEHGRSVVIQPDGKIIVAGHIFLGGANGFDMLAVRYNTNGTLDTTFAGGAAFVNFTSTDQAFDVALQPDGKILLAGRMQTDSTGWMWAIVRLNANGTLDTAFGTNGRTTFNGAFDDEARDVDVQADGKIVVAGFFGQAQNNGNFTVRRYNSNGTSDSTFALNTVGFFNANDEAYEVVQTSDNKYLVAGKCLTPSAGYSSALARYNSDGTIDTTFGSNGKLVLELNPNGSDSANDLSLQPDGKIVVAGAAGGSGVSSSFTLVRLSSSGVTDPTFGTGGRVNTVFGSNTDAEANAVAYFNSLAGADKIIAVGSAFGDGTPVNSNFAVARYMLSGAAAPSDFSGDGRADFGVFRPSNGSWYISNSANNEFTAIQFGQAGDVPVPGDYDRDGRTDAAVFRPSVNAWYILNSSNNSFTSINFGASGDKPVQGDYNGDGRTDIAVFRPSNNGWYVQHTNGSFFSMQFGTAGDRPAQADFDGDGQTDIAVFRPSNSTWYLQRSSLGFTQIQFGVAEDRVVPADYDGDGRADIAVFRPSNGNWYVQSSSNNSFQATQWGAPGDVPAPADFDADGRADLTVFRPSDGNWYALRSGDNSFVALQFGQNGDMAVPSAYVQQ